MIPRQEKKLAKPWLCQKGGNQRRSYQDLISLASFLKKSKNPVDLEAEKDELVSRLAPYFKNLQEAITAKDLDKTRQTYADLNNTWTRNEAVVRDHSTAYYGKKSRRPFRSYAVVLKQSLPTLPTSSPLMMTSKMGLMPL